MRLPLRLPLPLLAAVGSLTLALAAAAALAITDPSSVQAQAPTVQVVNVTQDEWSINPRHIVVKANQPVRFLISGTGAIEHRFVVSGMGIEDVRSDRVLPGGTITLDAVFTTPGTYQTWCSVGGGFHKDAGMVGTLTVVPQNADAVQNVSVHAGEFWFEPLALTAVAGQTTRFQLDVIGDLNHALQITGHSFDMRSPTVRPGEPVDWDVVLDLPGTYEIWCPFTAGGNHKALGMVGVLEVLPSGGGGGI